MARTLNREASTRWRLLPVASSLERKAASFAAEVARGDLRRSSLTDFLDATRDASGQLVANLNRAVELRPLLGGTAELVLAGDETVPVARRHVAELRRRLAV